MKRKMLNIKYECQHPSCWVFCKKGDVTLDESELKELSSDAGEEGIFKSPTGACRLGFSQKFKVVDLQDARERAETGKKAIAGALRDLMEEHKVVLEKLDTIEAQVRKRDIDGLWLSTASVENDIVLHSLKKEEEVLFPAVEKALPLGEALVGIMREDHKEFVSILHGFRCALQDGDILDGLVNTLIVSLRNHISKEDKEFLPMIDEHLDEKEKDRILEEMNKLEKAHILLSPGDRKSKGLSPYSEDRKRMDAEILAIKSITSKGGEACCH